MSSEMKKQTYRILSVLKQLENFRYLQIIIKYIDITWQYYLARTGNTWPRGNRKLDPILG